MLLRILLSVASATIFSMIGFWLLDWLWEYSHGPAEPSALAQGTIWAVVLLVFTLIVSGTYSLLNPHGRRAQE